MIHVIQHEFYTETVSPLGTLLIKHQLGQKDELTQYQDPCEGQLPVYILG